MQTIKLTRGIVGETPRVIIESPFEARNAIVSSQVCRWEKERKRWSMPISRMCFNSLKYACNKKFEIVVEDEKLREDVTGITSVFNDGFKLGAFNSAVLPIRETQRVGASMIGQLQGCMLAWDMGSGKTKTVFDAIMEYNFRRVMVVCPASVISVWTRQAETHLSQEFRSNSTIVGLDSSKPIARRADLMQNLLETYKNNPHHTLMFITNYEAVWRDKLAAEIKRVQWDLGVADESHRISTHSTAQSKFMSAILGPRCRHRVCLSGTPMGHGPIDLFGQFLFAEPGLFGSSHSAFKARWCIMGGFEGKQIVAYRDMEELTRRTSLLTTKVRLEDIVDLPVPSDEEMLVSLSAEGLRTYRELRDHFISEHQEGVITASNAITKLLRLQQVTSGYCSVEKENPDGTLSQHEIEIDQAKADVASDIVSDLPPDEPVVIFCRFTHDILQAHSVAQKNKRPSFEISGAKKEQLEWEKSCKAGKGPVIAVQIQSGGVGIDLTLARYCIYWSLGYSLTDYIQSRARVQRPGQTRTVKYFHLIVPGTVDRAVYKAIQDKKDIVDSVIEDIVGAQEHVK